MLNFVATISTVSELIKSNSRTSTCSLRLEPQHINVMAYLVTRIPTNCKIPNDAKATPERHIENWSAGWNQQKDVGMEIYSIRDLISSFILESSEHKWIQIRFLFTISLTEFNCWQIKKKTARRRLGCIITRSNGKWWMLIDNDLTNPIQIGH